MPEGGHHHHVASLALYEIAHVTEFSTRGDEVIKEDVVRAYVDLAFEAHTLAQTGYVGGIGVRDIGHGNDVVLHSHAGGRELGGVGCRYHIDSVALHMVVVDDTGSGITLHNICDAVVLHQVVNQPQCGIVVTMLGGMEVGMLAGDGCRSVVDDGRELVAPYCANWHRRFLAQDILGSIHVNPHRCVTKVHLRFVLFIKGEQYIHLGRRLVNPNDEIVDVLRSWRQSPPSVPGLQASPEQVPAEWRQG